MHKSLENDLQNIFATSAADNQDDTKPKEEPDEPIETYHIYPAQGGILITKEEIAEPVIDSTPPVNRLPLISFIPAIVASLVLIVFVLFVPTSPPTQHLTIRHSFTIPQDLQSQIIQPLTIQESQTIATTGRGHKDATYAHGMLTFYNGSFSDQLIPQNMLFTSTNGIQIVTDAAVTIPEGSPPTYGAATVTAHALTSGGAGNIPRYAINTACCAPSVKVVNPTDFTGGKNAKDYHIVTKQDIDNGVTPLTQSLDNQEQHALHTGLPPDAIVLPLPCSSRVTTNHHAGDEAASVTIHVSVTCSGIAYSHKALQEKARQLTPIPRGFILSSFSVHPLSTALTESRKGATITVIIIATFRYQRVFLPRVK
jgi:Baseplate J-like protein